MPKFIFENIEDYYTYYVLILKIESEIFWDYDYSFVLTVVANKTAFDNYIDYKTDELLNN